MRAAGPRVTGPILYPPLSVAAAPVRRHRAEHRRSAVSRARQRAGQPGINNPHDELSAPTPPVGEVFEHLPSGVLVADRDGFIVGHNATAREILGAVPKPESTCCELFGCRQPNTPLASACVSRLALSRRGPLPELRVDVRSGTGAGVSVWVRATALRHSGFAVLELRPGAVGDRRRRTDPHWIGRPRLRVHTLGRTEVTSAEASLGGEWLQNRPGELFKYLICRRGEVVAVDQLVEDLWPGAPPTRAANVRQAVLLVRDRLEPNRGRHAPSSFIRATRGGYELDMSNIWVDADEFQARVREGLDAIEAGRMEDGEALLESAVRMPDGEFMSEEPYAEWVLAERDRLREVLGRALHMLAGLRLDRHDPEGATGPLRELAELHPLDIEAQHHLLRVLVQRGRLTEAERRLRVARRRFRRALGAEPDLSLSTPEREDR